MSICPELTDLDIGLRLARPEDGAFLYQVYASTRHEELAQVPWNDAQREAFLRMQFRAQDRFYRSEYAGAIFEVIEVNSAAAGRLYVHRCDNEIRLLDIALLPAYRNRGIGTMLLEGILAEAERERKKVSIHVEVFNRAARLYERLGFEKMASNGIYSLMEWRPRVLA
jgi:ribosomal protein S18 acetylase RimI-like enzyme